MGGSISHPAGRTSAFSDDILCKEIMRSADAMSGPMRREVRMPSSRDSLTSKIMRVDHKFFVEK